ncbi:MAG: hypothetical protein QHC67_03590 [Sphingobium sp.]|uniref:LexA family protein n=1 Tax=Sphingobium sp. TaxID=1912891 RepID=UPI0029A9903C|nr:hypothetical protein [Sphingobium sp.]MDX3908882.1 hypothetical protein [Sphingobium sp.]
MNELVRLSPIMVSRKLQVLAFIQQYYLAHGVGPSLGEISAAVSCGRTRAHAAVRQLHKEGRIHRTPGQHRGIRPISVREEAIRVLVDEGWTVNLGRFQLIAMLDLPEGTNTSLPLPPELDHIPSIENSDRGNGASIDGAKRRGTGE